MTTASKFTPKSTYHRITLTNNELSLVLGALAETLEEKRHPYTGPDCRRLARLHSRLRATFLGAKTMQDYAVRGDGAVVIARKPSVVVTPANGLVDMLKELEGSMVGSHE